MANRIRRMGDLTLKEAVDTFHLGKSATKEDVAKAKAWLWDLQRKKPKAKDVK